jgi:hypothetical protein
VVTKSYSVERTIDASPLSDVEPPSAMVWSDGMPLGLFPGVRTFSLRAVDGDRKRAAESGPS